MRTSTVARPRARRLLPGGGVARLGARVGFVVAVVLAGVAGLPSVASAHGGDETMEGYLLVQQALGHLAHDTSDTGIELAMEKVDDALATEDQEGVDVAEVEQAMAALEAGQVDRARALLQDSIAEAMKDLPPATGSETGTSRVVPALRGRSGVDGTDWSFLAASALLVLLGAGLAIRFRPRDTVDDLRRALAHAGTGDEAETGDAATRGGRT